MRRFLLWLVITGGTFIGLVRLSVWALSYRNFSCGQPCADPGTIPAGSERNAKGVLPACLPLQVHLDVDASHIHAGRASPFFFRLTVKNISCVNLRVYATSLILHENINDNGRYGVSLWGDAGGVKAVSRPGSMWLYGNRKGFWSIFRRTTGFSEKDIDETGYLDLPPGRSISSVGVSIDFHGPGPLVECGPFKTPLGQATGTCSSIIHRPPPKDAIEPPDSFEVLDQRLFPKPGTYHAQAFYQDTVYSSPNNLVMPYRRFVPRIWADVLYELGLWKESKPSLWQAYHIRAESNIVSFEVGR